jgi:acetylornithine deacetylase/succinyl-diaminopimelate desuccinylase-like protein
LAAFEFPYRFNETTQTFFERQARVEQGQLAADMRAVAQQPPDLDAARRLSLVLPYYNSLLYTTAVATRLEAGHAVNALPQSAHAVVNCRLFPGNIPDFVQQTLVQVLADPDIKVIPMGAGRPAPASSLVPDVMLIVEQVTATMWPRLRVLSVMDPWTGDSRQLHRTGISTLGVSGIFGEMDFGNAHGTNERLPVQSYYEGIEFMHCLLQIL